LAVLLDNLDELNKEPTSTSTSITGQTGYIFIPTTYIYQSYRYANQIEQLLVEEVQMEDGEEASPAPPPRPSSTNGQEM
jgi:hypothetical protein